MCKDIQLTEHPQGRILTKFLKWNYKDVYVHKWNDIHFYNQNNQSIILKSINYNVINYKIEV